MNKELLNKYFSGDCSNDETEYIRHYFKEHPSELDTYFSVDEWDEQVEQHKLIDKNLSEQLYREIQTSIQPKRNPIRHTLKWVGAAAAAAILVFFIWTVGFDTRNTGNPDMTVTQQTSHPDKIYKNTSKDIQEISLPDGSVIRLFPGSEINHSAAFNTDRRDIYLSGKAEFDVAKNKEKPFTVYCGNISTRAIGTRFEVDGSTEKTSVQLFEGKVLVSSLSDQNLQKYLNPGDKIAYNTKEHLFEDIHSEHSLERIAFENPKIEKKSQIKLDLPSTEHSYVDIAYVNFQNVSLKNALTQLSELYQVEISYPTEVSEAINLYLSVDTTQSIEKILQNISSANNLTIRKINPKQYYISK